MKKTWEVKRLEEVCEIVNGGTPDTKISEYWGGEFLWLTPKDMGKLESIYVNDTERKITDTGLKNSSAKLLPINSIILSSRAPIGHLAINTEEIATNQGCKGIIPNRNLKTLFLYYFLKNSIKLLNDLGSGATFKELSGSKLAEIKIPLPPLPEQKLIVAILDEAFAAITKAKEKAEKNLRNARELFDSYLQSVFANHGDGWEEKRLDELAEIKGGKRVPKGYRLQKEPTKFTYIRVTDFNDNGTVDLDDIHYVNEAIYRQIKNYTISTKDLYISIAGTIGKTGMIPEKLNGANLTENACKLVFESDIEPRLVYFFTKSKDFLSQAGLNTRVAAMPKLALSRLSTISFFIPKSLSEQRSIVTKLDALSAETKKLESIYQKKLDSLDELKKSILQKAFAGELS